MSSLLDAALEYRGRGWSVIPISPTSKKPLIEWTDFQTRLASESEIRSWWKRNPTANIGLVTGAISGLVVVDVDTGRGGNPADVVKQAPASFVVQTGGGGYHLYYQHPGGSQRIPNQVGKGGLDVRADGGYVVAPPSRHANGRYYEWKQGNEHSKLTTPPQFAISPNGSNGSNPANSDWLSSVLAGVDSGNRNDSATRLAGYYLSKKMPKDVVLSTLEAWNERNSPPLSHKELYVIVESVAKTSYRKTSTQQRIPESGDPFALVSLNDYMTKYGDVEVAWTVRDWMPEQTIALAVAPPGTYKTWLELDLAVSVASGMPFLGKYPVDRSGPVIIIQQEDYHGQIAERLGAIIHSRLDTGLVVDRGEGWEVGSIPSLPIHIHPDRRLRFNDSIVLEALEAKIAEIRPALVVIDPLYSTGDTDDFMAKTVTEMFALKSMRDRYKTSFFIAHHTKKKSEGTEREDAWGSQFLNAFIETGWQIRPKDKPGLATVRRHFKVRQNIEEIGIKFDISTEPPYHYEVGLVEMDTKGEQPPDLLACLSEYGPMTIVELSEHFPKVHRTTISRRMSKLTAIGEAKRTDDGRFHLARDV